MNKTITVHEFVELLRQQGKTRGTKMRIRKQAQVGLFSIQRILAGENCNVLTLQRLAEFYGGEVCIRMRTDSDGVPIPKRGKSPDPK